METVGKVSIGSIILAIIAIIFLLAPSMASPWDNQVLTINKSDPNYSCDYNIVQEIGGKTRTIDEIDCSISQVVMRSTNASKIFNDAFSKVNANNGGRVHFKGYGFFHPYNITSPIVIPDSGNLYLQGDGAQLSTLAIPSTTNNINMFQTTGTKSADIFFNLFRDFQMIGNRSHGQTGTTGFNFTSTNHGMHDSVFDNLFIEDFARDNVYINTYNSWNMQFVNCVFEHAGQYNFDHAGGSDTRIVDSKFLFGHGTYSVFMAGGLNTIASSWFYQNDKNGLLLANAPNIVIGTKFYDNGLTASNTYHDISMSGAKSSVINANTFSGSDLTNKTKDAIFIGDNLSVNNTITGNNFATTGATNWGSPNNVINGFHNTGINTITGNQGWNPFGKVTNFIDNSGNYFVSVGGTTGTLTNGTTYTISDSPVFISSTGGTTVSITLLDNKGNTLQSGLTTLTQQFMPIGYKIKFTWNTIPTPTVYFQ